MDTNYLAQRKEIRQLIDDGAGQSFFDNLDPGRQADVIQCLTAIKTSKNPREVIAARKALATIYKEYQDPTLRGIRKWLMNEKKHGRHDNVKNLYADIAKNKEKFNPYG